MSAGASAVSATNTPKRPTDVSTLDVYGVRLSMSGDKVLRALRGRFGENTSFEISKGDSVFGHSRVFKSISMRRGDYFLNVTFQDALPASHPQPEQVSRVELKSKGYLFDGDSTKQRGVVEQEFIDAILAKYSPPDGFTICEQQGCPMLKQGSPYWCENPTSSTSAPCAFQNRMFETVLYGEGGGHEVYFGLILEDPAARSLVEDYWRTHPKKQNLSWSPFK